MTEDIFEKLGFERVEVSAEEADGNPFYYYTLDIGDICIMSNSDEAIEKGWEAFIFDSMTMKIKGSGDLEDLVRIIRNNTNG